MLPVILQVPFVKNQKSTNGILSDISPKMISCERKFPLFASTLLGV